MSAPNIATLYDFESQYEDAVAGYFANVNIGGQTFAQVLTPRTTLANEEKLITPRLEIKLAITGLVPVASGVQETPVTVGNVASNYYSFYSASLALGVVSARDNSAQNHGLLRGATRQGMLEITAALNGTTVPYYETVFMVPSGSLQGVDADNDEITTQLTYDVQFYIPPTSFPNS